MPFTDPRMEQHTANLKEKEAFKYGRGEPTAEDLDAVADEEKVKAATKPKRKIVAKG